MGHNDHRPRYPDTDEPETPDLAHVNDRGPNFYDTDKQGQFFLVRCYACGSKYGKENWACAVATGCCCWCGWAPPEPEPKPSTEPSTCEPQ